MDIYESQSELLDNDEITPAEAGFMQGCFEANNEVFDYGEEKEKE